MRRCQRVNMESNNATSVNVFETTPFSEVNVDGLTSFSTKDTMDLDFKAEVLESVPEKWRITEIMTATKGENGGYNFLISLKDSENIKMFRVVKASTVTESYSYLVVEFYEKCARFLHQPIHGHDNTKLQELLQNTLIQPEDGHRNGPAEISEDANMLGIQKNQKMPMPMCNSQ